MRRFIGAAGAVSVAFIAAALVWLAERRRRQVFPASDASALLNPARRLVQRPASVIRGTGVKRGDVVVELGAGPGYFTADALAAVRGGGGRVVSVDLQREMLTTLRWRLKGRREASDLVVADAASLPLRDAVIDAAFLVAVLGEVPDQTRAVAEIARMLRSGGIVSFVEMMTDPDYVRLPVLVRMCRNAGLPMVDWRRQPTGYLARFSRPS